MATTTGALEFAKAVATKVLALAPNEFSLSEDREDFLTVEADGGFIIDDAIHGNLAVLSARLTPQTIASVEALTVALLDGADCDGCYHALSAHDENGCTHERDASDGINVSAMLCACEAAVLAMEVAACA